MSEDADEFSWGVSLAGALMVKFQFLNFKVLDDFDIFDGVLKSRTFLTVSNPVFGKGKFQLWILFSVQNSSFQNFKVIEIPVVKLQNFMFFMVL